ncbi:hypothetical protein HYZ80_01340 [Candidatus Parcubacteria bacterium]|nr:hypothetical protein [Candidatus Parcubacteria bacterium]
MPESGKVKTIAAVSAAILCAAIALGLLWFFLSAGNSPVGTGWYLFSFAAGLTMIVLPCTLPLAFVIVPLSMGKGVAKGLGIALSFGLGVAFMLSLYGVAAAVVGQVAIGTLGAPLEVVKNWLYLVAGLFAYIFALGELGLVKFRMPSYTGAAPAFIQKKRDYLKAFLLGLFLGNVGVGCPHPATPVILTRIAASGDIWYGWLLFFVHAVGRILPLLLLALLGILGVNALSWLVKRKDKIERATGWGMVFVAGFILVLGLFTHDWWVYSGQHTLLESFTQEERFLDVIAQQIGSAVQHRHGIPAGTGLFGLPLWLGNWALVALWVFPMFWYYRRKKRALATLPDSDKQVEARLMPFRFWLITTLTALLALIFIWVLPDRFLYHENQSQREVMHEAMAGAEHGAPVHPGGTSEDLDLQFGHSSNPTAGSQTLLSLRPLAKPGNTPITELPLVHEAQVHLFGIREDLHEFFHLHPQSTAPGLWELNVTFVQPGNYTLWAEVNHLGVDHIFSYPIEIGGAGERTLSKPALASEVVVGGLTVRLASAEAFYASEDTVFNVEVHNPDGSEAVLEEYLGEKMHLVVLSEDLSDFGHAHPIVMRTDGEHALRLIPVASAHEGEEEGSMVGGEHAVQFQHRFARSGTYVFFAQFRPKGFGRPPSEALTAQFGVEVRPARNTTSSIFNSWAGKLIVSLTLAALLAWLTHGYITKEMRPKP